MAMVAGNGVAATAAAAAGRGWRRRRRRAAVTRSAAATGLDQQQHCRAGNRTAKPLTCHAVFNKSSWFFSWVTFWWGRGGRNGPVGGFFGFPQAPKISAL